MNNLTVKTTAKQRHALTGALVFAHVALKALSDVTDQNLNPNCCPSMILIVSVARDHP